jgi:flavin-binding protein dodecin
MPPAACDGPPANVGCGDGGECLNRKEEAMSVARVTEITASSSKSFQDALEQGIERANKTLKNVKGAWVQEQKVEVENGRVVAYRINMKVTFVLTD